MMVRGCTRFTIPPSLIITALGNGVGRALFQPAAYNPQQVKRMAILGLAAGTTARQATAVYGPIPIDGYEIDEKVVDIGRRFF